jgi:hypothetical protein
LFDGSAVEEIKGSPRKRPARKIAHLADLGTVSFGEEAMRSRPSEKMNNWEAIAATAALTAVLCILVLALYSVFVSDSNRSFIEPASNTLSKLLFGGAR